MLMRKNRPFSCYLTLRTTLCAFPRSSDQDPLLTLSGKPFLRETRRSRHRAAADQCKKDDTQPTNQHNRRRGLRHCGELEFHIIAVLRNRE